MVVIDLEIGYNRMGDVTKKIFYDMFFEYLKVRKSHSTMHTFHEAYAILLEEFDNYWEIVRRIKPRDKNHRAYDKNVTEIHKELIQIGAMVLATLKELVY